MALTLADLNDLKSGYRKSIWVGEVPYDVAKRLSLKSHSVYLNRTALEHINKDHPDVDFYMLLDIPFAIRRGLLVRERAKPNVFLSCHQSIGLKRRMIVAMKIFENGAEIWVSSYYKSRDRQTKSILARGTVLKNHD